MKTNATLYQPDTRAVEAFEARLARQTGLQERYVREWLGAMTAAGVVVMDPGTNTYHLPPEHA